MFFNRETVHTEQRAGGPGGHRGAHSRLILPWTCPTVDCRVVSLHKSFKTDALNYSSLQCPSVWDWQAAFLWEQRQIFLMVTCTHRFSTEKSPFMLIMCCRCWMIRRRTTFTWVCATCFLCPNLSLYVWPLSVFGTRHICHQQVFIELITKIVPCLLPHHLRVHTLCRNLSSAVPGHSKDAC